MRSRFEQSPRALIGVAVMALVSFAPSGHPAATTPQATTPQATTPQATTPQATSAASRPADGPNEAQIDAAMRKLREDPNLVSTTRIRSLHWVSSSDQPPAADPSWLQWIVNLFGWLAEGGRLLVWVICTVVVALLAVYLLRLLRAQHRRHSGPTLVAPTHVRDLDIRPESLPEDIGAAARELWDRGEHRASLALLYRGALSRLAHVHAVPIRHSTTEGESVELAARHLSVSGTNYVSLLVRIWQRAVYRGEEPTIEAVISLCDGFAAALDAPPAPSAAGQAA